MKKLMMLLAAVCVAGIVQGAAVDWQFGKDTSYNGYTVYAFDNANASTVLAALAAYDADAQSTIDGLVLASKTVSKGNAKVQGTDVGDATALMLLAVNGAFADGVAYKYDTLDITGYTYSGTDLPPGNATLAAFGNSGTVVAKGGGGGGGTPEPTSGLLLLVGAGILGLRRKRA
jgi:hypothetical protein